jgi:hypothetical protein
VDPSRTGWKTCVWGSTTNPEYCVVAMRRRVVTRATEERSPGRSLVVSSRWQYSLPSANPSYRTAIEAFNYIMFREATGPDVDRSRWRTARSRLYFSEYSERTLVTVPFTTDELKTISVTSQGQISKSHYRLIVPPRPTCSGMTCASTGGLAHDPEIQIGF